MTQTQSHAKVRMTRGKFDGINAVADARGVIAAMAIDQRGSLKKAIAKAKGADASDAELSEFKVIASELLTPHASAILLDPEYGLEAIKHRAPNTGVFLAYEKTGYDATVKGRLPDLLPEWQDGIPEYGKGGAKALRTWLCDRGVQNIQALNEVLAKGAKPWWDFYGGKQNIEVVDLPR